MSEVVVLKIVSDKGRSSKDDAKDDAKSVVYGQSYTGLCKISNIPIL
jgi:hypothetical protein